MNVWSVIYTHRFGTDLYVFDHEISMEDAEKFLEGTYEPEREDEYLEIIPSEVITKEERLAR